MIGLLAWPQLKLAISGDPSRPPDYYAVPRDTASTMPSCISAWPASWP